MYPRAPDLILGCALLSLPWEVPMAKILHHHACCPTLNQGAGGMQAAFAARPTRIEVVQDFVHQPSRILVFACGLPRNAIPLRGLHGNIKLTKADKARSTPQAISPRGRCASASASCLLQRVASMRGFLQWPCSGRAVAVQWPYSGRHSGRHSGRQQIIAYRASRV